MSTDTREARLRRMAHRQGLALRKSKTRDERALDYGRWWIINPTDNSIIRGESERWNLDQVEKFLTAEDDEQGWEEDDTDDIMEALYNTSNAWRF